MIGDPCHEPFTGTCESSYRFNNAADQMVCEECTDRNCHDCDSNKDTCTTCKDTYGKVSGDCVQCTITT